MIYFLRLKVPKFPTYVSQALNHQSQIDYVVTFSPLDVVNFVLLDSDLNFSDRLPLIVTVARTSSLDSEGRLLADILYYTASQKREQNKILASVKSEGNFLNKG